MRASIEYIKSLNKKNLVGAEVGVKLAEHAEEIIKYLNPKKMHLIDWYITWPEHREMAISKMASYNNVEWHIMQSFEAAIVFDKEYFDFVYLDNNHSYEHVIEEIEIWLPKIKKGGVLCGHDYALQGINGVSKAVDEFADKTGYKVNVGGADWWFTK